MKSLKNFNKKANTKIDLNKIKGGNNRAGGKGRDDIYSFEAPPVLF